MRKLFLTLILAASSIVASAQRNANTTPRVSISAFLEGRGTEGSLPRPSYNVQESGAVVVTVWVNNASSRPGVIKFLDIPVDGNRRAFETALESKGFSQPYKSRDGMEGVFNGENIVLFVSTNHDIVDRVQVKYPNIKDEDSRVKFNNLISRFDRTGKYVTLRDNEFIPETEDISRRMYLDKKRYDAIYYYLEPDVNPSEWKASFMREYNKRYSKNLQTLSQEELEEIMFCLPEEIVNSISGVVWFYLPDSNHLEIFYDNMKNRPHGEDL